MMPKALGSAAVRPIILSILARHDSYGYEIIQFAKQISGGDLELQAGILYPILRGFESEGLIKSYWKQPPGERKRRYYRLTAKGKKSLETEKQAWIKMHDAFLQLWAPDARFA